VIDLFSRKVVGWHVSDTLEATLVATALEKALHSREVLAEKLTFHSDRGKQYCSNKFRDLLKTYKVRQSMSRSGNCLDNSVAESFFRSIKVERIKGLKLENLQQARAAVYNYIECFYNCRRQHSFLLGYSPIQWEMVTSMNPAIVQIRNQR
jgi:transposase InsO family protein